MLSLASCGERVGAIRHASAHAALLSEELDVAPDPQITRLARRLRDTPDGAPEQSTGKAAHPGIARSLGTAASESKQHYLDHLRHALAGRYEVRERIVHGSVTTAFRATDSRGGRQITLRVVHPALAALLDVRRFIADMRRVMKLDHPGLATLVDVGEGNGVVYYAWASVEGETLRSRLVVERQLSIAAGLDIALRIDDALAAAHAAGVLHIDLKPRHIILAAGGAVLTELGVAAAVVSAAGESVTQTGVTMGTAAYMSPEQVSGDGCIDARSDIYSLGCTVYHMLAGEPPFAGSTAQAVLVRRLTEEVRPLRRARERVSPRLDQVITQMLARVPADRFQSADDVHAALSAADIASPLERSRHR